MKTLAEHIRGVPRSAAFRPVAMVAPWLACVAVALLVHAAAPALVNDYWVNVLRRVGVFVIAAVSLNIVNGYTGQFSMGHAGFMAIGAYAGAAITYYGSLYWHGGVGDPAFAAHGVGLMLAGVGVGAVLAAGAGYLVGLPSLRLRGDYLAIVTLGFGEIIRVLLELTGKSGPQLNAVAIEPVAKLLADPSPPAVRALVLDPTPERIAAAVREPGDAGLAEQVRAALGTADVQELRAFWEHPLRTLARFPLNGPAGFFGVPAYAGLFWVWLFVGLTCVVAYRVKQSSSGRAFLSIREDEIAARSMGIDLTKYKVRAFVLAAFFGGVAGALYAHIGANPSPPDAGFQRSFEIIIMVVLGGLGSISGSVLAAVLLIGLPEALRELQQYRLIVYALLLIVMMLVRPKGLLGVREVWDVLRPRRSPPPAPPSPPSPPTPAGPRVGATGGGR